MVKLKKKTGVPLCLELYHFPKGVHQMLAPIKNDINPTFSRFAVISETSIFASKMQIPVLYSTIVTSRWTEGRACATLIRSWVLSVSIQW